MKKLALGMEYKSTEETSAIITSPSLLMKEARNDR